MKYGRSNDEGREDEIVLAKMLQSARARGLRPHTGWFYDDFAKPTKCCALGAWKLDEDIGSLPYSFSAVSAGNDDRNATFVNHTGYAIGAAFQEAMRDD